MKTAPFVSELSLLLSVIIPQSCQEHGLPLQINRDVQILSARASRWLTAKEDDHL